MSSSDDGEPQVPMMTAVVHARSGADFEAGRGGRPRGEHIKGRAYSTPGCAIEPEDEAAEAEMAADGGEAAAVAMEADDA